MLGLAGDDVVFLASFLEEARDALDAHVVALRRAAGEDDFFRVRADEGGDVFARLLDGFVRLPAVGVGAGVGVAVQAGEEGEHGVEDSRVGRGGGLHVEVDGSGAFVHYRGLFEDCGGRTHCRVAAHARRGELGIFGCQAGLIEEGFLVLADGALDADGGVLGAGLRDIASSAASGDACSRCVGGEWC